MQDITNRVHRAQGSNQHQDKVVIVKEGETKWQKTVRYLKITAIHLLIAAAAAGFIYGRIQQYVAGKEKVVLQGKIQQLEEEKDTLKAKLR
jgi:hypothetical protein